MPVPLLILLSFLAMVLYMVVGGLVTVVAIRVFSSNECKKGWLCRMVNSDDDHWISFWFLLPFWPASLLILSVLAIFVGPVFLTKKVAHYAVEAQVNH